MKPTFREQSQSLPSPVWYIVWHHSPDNEDQDDCRNVGFIYTSDVADCPRRLYQILSPRKLLNIKQHYKLYSSMFWWVKHDISVKKACMKFRILNKFAEKLNRESERARKYSQMKLYKLMAGSTQNYVSEIWTTRDTEVKCRQSRWIL
jgi:hypothetical protein